MLVFQIQFCLMVAYMLGLLAYDCKLPKALTLFFVANASIFLVLFSDFYRKSYIKKEA
jgi:elongation of very long chain fatty acids protein 4